MRLINVYLLGRFEMFILFIVYYLLISDRQFADITSMTCSFSKIHQAVSTSDQFLNTDVKILINGTSLNSIRFDKMSIVYFKDEIS